MWPLRPGNPADQLHYYTVHSQGIVSVIIIYIMLRKAFTIISSKITAMRTSKLTIEIPRT